MKKIYLSVSIVVLFFFALALWGNIQGIYANCWNVLDVGVYHQALMEIAAKGDLNPYLTARGIKIFNDHFDPIIFLAVPFYWVLGPHPWVPLLFEWLVVASCGLLVFFLAPGPLMIRWFWALSIFLCKALLGGLWFPIHPTTWSFIPILLLFWSIHQQKSGAIIASTFFLCLFKESFAFSLILLPIFFLWQRQWKIACYQWMVIGLFLGFELGGRKNLLGSIYGHGNSVWQSMLQNPGDQLHNAFWAVFNWQFWSYFYPLSVPLFFLVRPLWEKKNFFTDIAFAGLLFFVPLVGLHLLAQKIGYHYNLQFVAVIFAVLIFRPPLLDFFNSKRWVGVTMVLLILSSMGSYRKWWNLVVLQRHGRCEISAAKSAATRELRQLLAGIDLTQKKLMASGGVVPQLLAPNNLIYHYGGYSQIQDSYDYLLLERHNSGNTWPLGAGQIEEIIRGLPGADLQILMDNQYYFLAKGKMTFPQASIDFY